MKHVLPAAIAFSLIAGGLAQAQVTSPSTAPASGTVTPSTTAPMTPGTSGNGITGAPTMGGTGAAGTTTGMGAAAPGRIATTPAPAAVTTTTAPSRTNSAPVAGANSYTEAQARARIQEKGFGQVTGLKKDDKGVWRGTAMKDGKSTKVALDYQGNIVSQ